MAKKNRPKNSPPIRLISMGENEWEFEYPGLSRKEYERFDDLLDLRNSGTKGSIAKVERGYRRLIKEFPEFIHIYHNLAILLDETDREAEAFQLWERAVDMGFDCFPGEFSIGRDRLPWVFIGNRPFLRAYHGYGLKLLEKGFIEDALDVFNTTLSLNPGDNQGVRSLAVICNFVLQRPWDVLAIAQQYKDDLMPELLYGQVLALLQLGLKSDAEEALGDAVGALPLVAQELVKKRHLQPAEVSAGYIIVGGPDEAYLYWRKNVEFWNETPGAIDFLRGYLSKNEPGLPRESDGPELRKSPLVSSRSNRKGSAAPGGPSIPESMRPIYETITDWTDNFCDAYLNQEYKEMCRRMTAELCNENPSPLTRGRTTTWAAAIVYTIGRINFLFDKDQVPHIPAKELCRLMETSTTTAATKSSRIMELLDIMQFEPEWTLPSLLDDNPLVWLISVDGLIVDIRDQPGEVQEEAYRKGLIPYLPKEQRKG